MIVEEKNIGRKKREVPESIRDVRLDFSTARARGLRVYVTAQLNNQEPNLIGNFVIGDNHTYNGYYNAPLSPSKDYNVWYGAFAVVDGVRCVCLRAFDKTNGVTWHIINALNQN